MGTFRDTELSFARIWGKSVQLVPRLKEVKRSGGKAEVFCHQFQVNIATSVA